ncbi:MAG: glycosyltransferase family 2 protein [Clostridia bacterium]|nr:glycosyltransferase family 2 protein [Clostridia bacterium]
MSNVTISLIVPCYNVEKVCDRFFQSLLEQDFTDVQLIFVNDGSTDQTENKLFSYREALEKLGYQFDYVYQENRGLGGAINTGLKKVCGTYLCWADPDDYFEKNAFSARVTYMDAHPECMALETDSFERNDSDREHYTLASSHFPETREPKQFWLLLNYRSNFNSGCHMLRVEGLRKVNPEMDIYEARRGQNWQMLLPVYYEFDRHYLDVPVYNYIVYEDSMSHSVKSYDDYMKRYQENGTIQSETIKRMHIPEEKKAEYLHRIDMMTTRLYLYAAMGAHKKHEFKEQYKKLKKNGEIGTKDRIRYFRLMLLNKG